MGKHKEDGTMQEARIANFIPISREAKVDDTMKPESALVKQIGGTYASRDHTAGEARSRQPQL